MADASATPKLVVAIRTPELRHRLHGAARALHIEHWVSDLDPHQSTSARNLLCVELGATPTPNWPETGPRIIIIPEAYQLHGDSLSIPPGGGVPLPATRLTPEALLTAILTARAADMSHVISRFAMFRSLPDALLRAFICDPARFHRLSDLRSNLCLSRDRARDIVRSTTRFARAEHLFTALRSVMWALLTSEGIQRRAVEDYLGIDDRAHFRRSCRRARIPIPRLGIGLSEFSG